MTDVMKASSLTDGVYCCTAAEDRSDEGRTLRQKQLVRRMLGEVCRFVSERYVRSEKAAALVFK